MATTVRNLRIREDTPKYLRNLALDSAHYDPKARSMRANPFPNENPEDLAFAGDNFVRFTGDALTMTQTQVLCWEMQNRGESIDLISNPSQAELMQKQFKEKKVPILSCPILSPVFTLFISPVFTPFPSLVLTLCLSLVLTLCLSLVLTLCLPNSKP